MRAVIIERVRRVQPTTCIFFVFFFYLFYSSSPDGIGCDKVTVGQIKFDQVLAERNCDRVRYALLPAQMPPEFGTLVGWQTSEEITLASARRKQLRQSSKAQRLQRRYAIYHAAAAGGGSTITRGRRV